METIKEFSKILLESLNKLARFKNTYNESIKI